MGPEALILVTVMGLIAIGAAAGAAALTRRWWGLLTGAPGAGLAGDGPGAPAPRQYATWGRERRVAHWARTIVRQARSAAEAGTPAGEVFSPALVDQMRRADPHYELILPLVLADIAESESVDPAMLAAAFARGTGAEVELTPSLVEERREARRRI